MKKLPNLNFKNIEEKSKKIDISNTDKYIVSYPVFLKHFQNIEKFDEHQLIIASNIIYGWMPRVLSLNLNEKEKVISLLNKVKKGEILDKDEILTIKKCVNNSLVGTSKLLHFTNPKNYAIWDSKVYKSLTGKKSAYGVENPDNYFEYLKEIKNISENENFNKIKKIITDKLKYDIEISPTRIIELIIFKSFDQNKLQ